MAMTKKDLVEKLIKLLDPPKAKELREELRKVASRLSKKTLLKKIEQFGKK